MVQYERCREPRWERRHGAARWFERSEVESKAVFRRHLVCLFQELRQRQRPIVRPAKRKEPGQCGTLDKRGKQSLRKTAVEGEVRAARAMKLCHLPEKRDIRENRSFRKQ